MWRGYATSTTIHGLAETVEYKKQFLLLWIIGGTVIMSLGLVQISQVFEVIDSVASCLKTILWLLVECLEITQTKYFWHFSTPFSISAQNFLSKIDHCKN